MDDAAAVTEEQRRWLASRRAAARRRRKERESALEIRDLNLTAMMDMMTIILVFLLKSFSASTVASATSGDVRPPASTTRQTPREAVPVTITSRAILVKGSPVVTLRDGAFPEGELQGRLVLGLDAALKKEVAKLKQIASARPDAPFSGEMAVIADRGVPYQLLTAVLYTAGQNGLDRYRFVVLQKDAVATPP
ncbi:MAG: biopolymer transporter ExbD [Myxococcaceae bacterium]|nr:biopolymer transporter ExbD [Myxococcaceae bacterium]MCI0672172.1 biopolymer transporter ExbD [Myxococcaceae bacterium]